MEKDDKIRNREAQVKKYVWMTFFAVATMSLFFVYHHSSSSSPAVDSSTTTSNRLKSAIGNPPGYRRDVVIDQGQTSEEEHPHHDLDPADAAIEAAADNKFSKEEEDEDKDGDGDESLEALIEQQAALDAEIRKIKKNLPPGSFTETDPEAQRVIKLLQAATTKLLKKRYGDYEHYRIRVDVEFQPSHPEYDANESGQSEYLIIEMAPIEYIPVSVYNFLEVARTYKSGAFHRNAGHVLQVRVKSGVKRHMPFQEYSPNFPHKKGTAGYCGRPSGPCWYVSIMDNSKNHGPGSQQKQNPYEADSNFGTIIKGMDDVVPKIHRVPQNGWLDKDKEILIPKMTILIPDGNGDWKEYIDPTNGEIAADA